MTPEQRVLALARYQAHAERFDAIARRSDPRPAFTPPRAPAPPTPRESEILAHVAAGLTNKEIAEHLGLAEETVKTRIARMLPRIGANNRAHAVAIALRNDWIGFEQADPLAA
jgi:DNA-binding NarL/FixJ family response regulator